MARILLALPQQNLTVDTFETAKAVLEQIEKGKMISVTVSGQKRHYNSDLVVIVEESQAPEGEPETETAAPVPDPVQATAR